MSATKASIWFWSDWDSDPALRLCSLAAQGLWMRMLCIAARHDPTGYVAVNRVGLGSDDIARMAGADPTEVRSLIAELERNGVFTRDRNGTIFNRRMIREEKKRQEGKKYGKRGGNPALIAATEALTHLTCRTQTPHPDTKKRSQIAGRLTNGNDTGITPTLNPPLNPELNPPLNPLTLSLSKETSSLTSNEIFKKLLEAAGGRVSKSPSSEIITPILDLIAMGCDLDQHILPVVRSSVPKLSQPLQSWGARWLRDEILARRETVKVRPLPDPSDPMIDFPGGFRRSTSFVVAALAKWQNDPRSWPSAELSAPPDSPGCRVPKLLLQQAGIISKEVA